MNLATAPGDTVQIPAGSSSWTSGVSWTNTGGILLGAGSLSTTGGGDATVITDNISGSSNLKVMDLQGLSEIAGITVQSGTGSVKDSGTVRVGQTTNLKIHHCHFDTSSDSNYQVVQFGGGVRGVMYECIVDLVDLNGLYFYNGRSDPEDENDEQGNYEWTQPTAFGTSDYFYIEDCVFNNEDAGRIWDGFTAAKVVVRFCTVVNGGLSEAHATGHSPDDRGTRSQEIYGNSVTTTLGATGPSFAGVDFSSGTGLAWGNSWDGAYKHCILLNVTRKNNDTYGQSATPNGWGYAGTAFNGTGSNWDGGTFNGTSTSDGYPCLDMPGRGAGDLLVGLHPNKVNNTTGTIRWPNQAHEPIYMWNNTGTFASGWGGSALNNNTGGRAAANRDYYAQASGIQTNATTPFNGTSGTGWGTLANRPTTCTTGVAYWATDQGDWNTSASNPYGVNQSGNSGVLYVATATDTWSLYYEPYTYPHPLRSDQEPTGNINFSGTLTVGTLAVG